MREEDEPRRHKGTTERKAGTLGRHAEGWTAVTALAVAEAEVAAECSLAGVTRRTRLSAGGNEVLGRGGRAHLTRLRRTRGELVAISAGESLARAVLGMTERVTKSARVSARGPVRLLIVTHAA